MKGSQYQLEARGAHKPEFLELFLQSLDLQQLALFRQLPRMFLHVLHICLTAAEILVHHERLIFHALLSEPYCFFHLFLFHWLDFTFLLLLWRRLLPAFSSIIGFRLQIFLVLFYEFLVEVFGPLSFLSIYLLEIPLPPQRPYSQYFLELGIVFEYVIQVFVLYAENIWRI